MLCRVLLSFLPLRCCFTLFQLRLLPQAAGHGEKLRVTKRCLRLQLGLRR
jgi:hypothetical protein